MTSLQPDKNKPKCFPGVKTFNLAITFTIKFHGSALKTGIALESLILLSINCYYFISVTTTLDVVYGLLINVRHFFGHYSNWATALRGNWT